MFFTDYDRDFYPTPEETIDEIMMGEDVSNKIILEPSAGSGNIVRWLNRHGAKEVLASEIDPSRRKLLSGCRVIGSDFLKLSANDIPQIQYIVQNPPFSRAVEHLRHAWEIAPVGCTIISVMPSTVFDNTYSSDRKALKELIQLHGSITQLGQCFQKAERRTDVGISMVKMFKEGTGEQEFKDYFFDRTDIDDGTRAAEGIVGYDAVRDLVNRYKGAVERYDAVIAASNEINALTDFSTMLTPEKKRDLQMGNSSTIRFGAFWTGRKEECPQEITRAIFKKQLTKDAWHFVFNLFDMRKYATHKLLQQIDRFVEQQEHVPFTMRNIYKMIQLVIGTNAQRMESCLVDAFETICSFSADNSTAGEGWKTNSDYMVNRRFIIPSMTGYDSRWPSEEVTSNHCYQSNWNKMEDVEKALCYLIGMNYEEHIKMTFVDRYTGKEKTELCRSMTYRLNLTKAHYGEWFDFGTFWRCRAYKKGTMHFEFKDEDVWMKFNAAVAKVKGWNFVGTNSKNAKKSKK